MEKQTNKLKEILMSDSKGLLLTHMSIDHDAICSSLLFYRLMKKANSGFKLDFYVNEDVWPQFTDWGFEDLDIVKDVSEYSEIDFESYDYIFLLDVSDLDRSLYKFEPSQEILDKTIIVDHHTTKPLKEPMLNLNNLNSSNAEHVYLLFKEMFPEIKIDEQDSYLAQIGMLADTNRFMYGHENPAQTFQVMSELTAINQLNMQQTYYKLWSNTYDGLKVLSYLIEKSKKVDDCVYTVLDEDFYENGGFTSDDIRSGTDTFLQFYVRTIKDVNWGFLVKPYKEDKWSVSFRAIEDTKDVGKLAESLGGGGHTGASGAKIEASSIEEVVEKIFDIEKNF